MLDSMNLSFDFLWNKNAPKLDEQFADWLYSDWSEEKYNDYKFLDSIPYVSDYMDYLLDLRADQEYLNRYGMDYSDIHDPRKLKQTSSSSRLTASALNFVSRNVTRLYRH